MTPRELLLRRALLHDQAVILIREDVEGRVRHHQQEAHRLREQAEAIKEVPET